MIYHIAEFLDQTIDLPGAGMFNYISFRSAIAIVCSLLIGMVFGKSIIRMLQRHQIGEEIRNLGLEGQLQKKGTPTMGGLIILAAILVPVLLFADLTNVYIQLMLATTVWLGLLGFLDDYIKVFRKKKEGLNGRFKILGQVTMGLIVGTTMWIHPQIVSRESSSERTADAQRVETLDLGNQRKIVYMTPAEKSTSTTVPFFKNSELDYRDLIPVEGHLGDTLGWLLYVLIAVCIITAVSNGANLTDGLDGLAAGVSAAIGVVLGILAYLSGNVIYADYLDIMNIPGSGELLVFAGAFVGALLGFLWYNSYPAQVFMGDTGSLAIGGIIATFALLIRKELLLPILCGIFLVESLSVIIQVCWFKYTKHKYGEGRRVFLMSPLHHHYQKKGYFEVKIVTRFWIVQLLLAAITLMTLKIR
ncbi:phospho-N-acetylmuramoyl-pentapeptide-transferase [Millionella massiliensis]|uniref:phospho-N-acetylmuramoyl-pentapeptide- transferase n=1 Tax=Millionella massiliensis TaxID=1871023 RepID=UPI0023A7DBD9|nr:phospho-N-acetylmuramoyl-pentapeptide-transferase [Millionella massiliensis]